MTEKTKKKMSTSGKKPWWNNGVTNQKALQKPGDNWVSGMVKRKQ